MEKETQFTRRGSTKGKKGPPKSHEWLAKTKDIIIGTSQAGTVISRRKVINIVSGVVKANEPNLSLQKTGLEMS